MGSTDKKIKSSHKDKKEKSSSKDKKEKHSSNDKKSKSSSKKDKKEESTPKEEEEEEEEENVEATSEGKEVEVSAEEERKDDESSTKDIEKALKDPTKKRKAEDEIEIDLESSIPLSKKQKRLLRRGKITLKELNDKYNIDPSSIDQYKKEQKDKKEGEDGEDGEAGEKKEKVKTFGVWVGNLSFDTTSDEIKKFIVGKTKELEDEESRIREDDIVRIKLPLANNDGKQVKNKGFCYIDFKTEAQMKSCVKLSENQLNGRNLLIKDSKNFEGRPDKDDLVTASKNPPSRILFVGNLSYTTTDDLLRSHFQHCGEIIKVRMATFEDSGKCKGFAFIDFKDETGATKALTDKSLRKIALRPIRMEYGEDRSKRQVRRRPEQFNNNKKQFDLPSNNYAGNNNGYKSREGNTREFAPRRDEGGSFSQDRPPSRKPRTNNRNYASNNRVKSSIALAGAQRGSAAIVPSQGKKMKFD